MALPLLERTSVNLYYLGSRVAFSFFLFTVALFKDAYRFGDKFSAFLALTILVVNTALFLRGKNLYSERFLRYGDYLVALLAAVFSQNFYGVVPVGLVIILYSVLFWSEMVVFTSLVVVALLFATHFGGFDAGDFPVAVVYLLSVSLVSTKWNLLRLIKSERDELKRQKSTIYRLNREMAVRDRELRLMEEVRSIVEKLASLKRSEEIPRVLANFLSAEEVEVEPYKGKIPISDTFLSSRAGKVLLKVKPKHRFLLKDAQYRRKVHLLTIFAKPYLESFLAKRR